MLPCEIVVALYEEQADSTSKSIKEIGNWEHFIKKVHKKDQR